MERRGTSLLLSNFKFEFIVLNVVRLVEPSRAFEHGVFRVTLMADMLMGM
jgi:hypothetical protein